MVHVSNGYFLLDRSVHHTLFLPRGARGGEGGRAADADVGDVRGRRSRRLRNTGVDSGEVDWHEVHLHPFV